MSWIIISIGILLSSPIMYLFVRKEKELNKDIAIQYLSIFLIPTIVYFIYNLISKTSMIIEFKYFLMLLGAALLFSLLGNIFSMKAIQLASNPGYISAVNVASISLLTVLYRVFFKDTLTLKKMLGVIGILIGLIILFV